MINSILFARREARIRTPKSRSFLGGLGGLGVYNAPTHHGNPQNACSRNELVINFTSYR